MECMCLDEEISESDMNENEYEIETDDSFDYFEDLNSKGRDVADSDKSGDKQSGEKEDEVTKEDGNARPKNIIVEKTQPENETLENTSVDDGKTAETPTEIVNERPDKEPVEKTPVEYVAHTEDVVQRPECEPADKAPAESVMQEKINTVDRIPVETNTKELVGNASPAGDNNKDVIDPHVPNTVTGTDGEMDTSELPSLSASELRPKRNFR